MYDFLNPDKEHAMLAAYIVGIAVGCCVLFTLSRGLILLRQRICRKKQGDVPAGPPEQLDEWDLVEAEPKPASDVGVAV